MNTRIKQITHTIRQTLCRHRYSPIHLHCEVDEDDGAVFYYNTCVKCGKPQSVCVPVGAVVPEFLRK